MELGDFQPYFDDLVDAYRDMSQHTYPPQTNTALLNVIFQKLEAIRAIVDA